MTNTKVSIIIPIYNTSDYLKSCLDSVAKQSHQNLEVILIDDGSTDQSGQIADNFTKKDSRFQIIHQKNQGQSAARNAGLKIASGDFINFIDSDDVVDKNFIKKLLKPFDDPDLVLSICGFSRHFLASGKTEPMFLSPMATQSPNETNATYILKLMTIDGRLYSSVNKLYLAKYAKKCRFDQKLNFAEDTKFVLDYLKIAKSAAFAFIPEALYTYNFGTKTSTINSSSLVWQNWQQSYHNLQIWLGDNPSPQEKFWLKLILLRWRISYLRSKLRAKK